MFSKIFFIFPNFYGFWGGEISLKKVMEFFIENSAHGILTRRETNSQYRINKKKYIFTTRTNNKNTNVFVLYFHTFYCYKIHIYLFVYLF